MSDLIQKAVSQQALQHQSTDVLSAGLSPAELLQQQQEAVATVQAGAESSPTHMDEPFFLDNEQRFPPEFAVLYVEARGDRYLVRAHTVSQRPLYTDPSVPPPLAFGEQMEKQKHKPAEIRGIMRQFSHKNPEAKKVRGWLTKLRKSLREAGGEALAYVVIHDRTNFEIPWELFNLTDHEHLGSSVVTVRWQDIQCMGGDDEKEEGFTALDMQAGECQGQIMAYANTKDFQGVKEEINLLKRYNAHCVEDVRDFLRQLHQVRMPVSLIFVASHGFISEGALDAAIGEQDKKQRISLSELSGWDFEFLKTDRSIVFMNACHSGRLRWDTVYTEQRMGLATFFLERGARGVIGTMGQVEDEYAPKIAQNFLAKYQDTPTLSVAAILRLLRAQALANLQADPSEENWSLFLFTFMYVYYGNPMTTLSLVPPRPESDTI